jgi:hypothetical protein
VAVDKDFREGGLCLFSGRTATFCSCSQPFAYQFAAVRHLEWRGNFSGA